MKSLILIISISLLPLLWSFDVPASLASICPMGCKRYYNCDEVWQKCVYKGFFPIYPLEAIEIIILSISSALATACGIGGGTVYSAFFLSVQEFEPKDAFPISNCIIWFCGSVTFIASVLDKFKNPKNKFVNYDFAIVFAPSLLLGVKFGTIFNKIFNSLFLTVSVLIVLWYSISSTFKNVKKAKKKEEDYQKSLELAEINKNVKEPLLYNPIMDTQANENTRFYTEEEKEILNEDNNPLRMNRIVFMLFLEVILIIDQFIEGNSNLTSVFGVVRCSKTYWAIFSGYILISLILLRYAYITAINHSEMRKHLDENYNSDKITKLSKNIGQVIFVSMIAGVVSSMIGIGGGMITNPLLATLGLDPKESSSTSNCLIIIGGIASTLLFSFAGQLDYSYLGWWAIPCIASALSGSFLILAYINKTKRSSFLIVIMLYFLIISMIIISFKGYYDLKEFGYSEFLTMNPYC